MSLLNLAARLFSFDKWSNPVILDRRDWSFSSVCINLRKVVWSILWLPMNLVVAFVLILFQSGPFVCMALSSWRLWVRDFGDTGRDDSKANLIPALIIFYVLVLLQGAFLLPWILCEIVEDEVIQSVNRRCIIYASSAWGRVVVEEYLMHIRVKCKREPASISGSSLVRYAVGLLDSELPDKYRSGARMLNELMKQGEDVRSLLLLSRPKVQKLIDTLGWRSIKNREIRELAARILADLASDMYVAQFPGAMRCISSLLETNEAHFNKLQNPNGSDPSPQNDSNLQALRRQGRAGFVSAASERGYTDGDQKSSSAIQERQEDGGTCSELILQGLTILERLASNHHNCRDICGTPGLIPKIMAPIYSRTLMQEIKIAAWANVVKGSLKVLHQLIRSPGMTGRMLRYDMSFNQNSMSNLEGILVQGKQVDDELKMRAMEILTELAMDSSININRTTEEHLIVNQLEIFLSDEQGEEKTGAMLRITAGRALAILTNKSEINCLFLTGIFKNIIDRLTTIMLDSNTSIAYREIAAEILGNLCTYCEETLHQQNVAETLLSKILTEMLCKRQRNISEIGNGEQTMLKRLVLACLSSVAVTQKRDSSNQGNNEEQTVPKQLQESFLSLILVIYDRMIGADEFADAVQARAPGRGAFVAKLNSMIEENHQPTPSSLRIIKLCCEIAIAMMKRSQYTEHFKDQKFGKSLSEATKIMSDLESCMLFAGTDFGVKKTSKPLLYDLEKEFKILSESVG